MSITDAVQVALVGALRADATLAAEIGDRVFDAVPEDAVHPYVSLGPEDWRDPMADCLIGETGVVQIDIWSRDVGRRECKRITDRIERMFRDGALALPAPYRCVSVAVILRRILQDPDGRTSHGVVQLRIETEEVA